MRRGGETALRNAGRFFMRDDPVHQTLRAVTRRLQEHKIPYAVAGGMALVAHGYDRTTVDIDILTTAQGLAEIHERLEGLGYVPPFPNSTQLRDTQTGVRIEFLVTGKFPGDGKPKPVAFPDPAASSFERDGIRYLNLGTLIELKLASGMTSPGRLKDLADVQELIRVLKLPADFSGQLNSYVREKFAELWAGVRETSGQEPSP
jgi:aminoglycoside-2''-adenylyltransferase